MNQRLTLLLLAAALTTGCGKKNDDKSAEAAKPTAASDEASAAAPKVAKPPPEPGLEVHPNLLFCDKGKHVEENVMIAAGSPYAALIRGDCQLTLKHCTLIASPDADQPAVQVMENGVARFEDCTLVSHGAKLPALWVSAGGKATIVRSRLESPMENAVDVWENSSVDYFDVSWTGKPNVRETGKLTKLDAMPPPL